MQVHCRLIDIKNTQKIVQKLTLQKVLLTVCIIIKLFFCQWYTLLMHPHSTLVTLYRAFSC